MEDLKKTCFIKINFDSFKRKGYLDDKLKNKILDI